MSTELIGHFCFPSVNQSAAAAQRSVSFLCWNISCPCTRKPENTHYTCHNDKTWTRVKKKQYSIRPRNQYLSCVLILVSLQNSLNVKWYIWNNWISEKDLNIQMTWGAEQTGPTEESERVISTVYIVLTKKLRRTRLSNRIVASTSCPQNHMFFVENFFSCGHFGSSQNQNWRSKNNICSLLFSSPTANVVLPLMVIGPVAAEQGIHWERLQRHSCIAIQKVLKQRYNFQNVSDFNDEKDTSLTRLQQLWRVWSLVLCPDQSESETLFIGNVWSFASGFFLYLTPVFFSKHWKELDFSTEFLHKTQTDTWCERHPDVVHCLQTFFFPFLRRSNSIH